jgi:small-conductance mechanosensitive channel
VWAAWGSLLLAGLLFVGWWVPDSIERVAGLDALAQTIRLVAATLATVLVLFAIARNGKAPKFQLRGSRRLPPIPIKFFASAAVLAVYLLWLGGAGQLAFTLAVTVVFVACERALYPMVRFFWPDFGKADAEFSVLPGLVLRVLRLGFACLGFVAVLAAWNLPLMQMSMAESPAGRFLAHILSALALILAADLAWALIKGAIDSRLNHLGPIELDSGAPGPNARLVTLLPLLRMAIGVALSVLLVLSVLSVLGIEITPLLAGAGVVGIALGFGAQTLVRDVLSGVFYLVEDVFRLGEYIESGSSTKGTVERITLRSVALRHQNGPLHFVPYGTLGAVRNNSRDWIIEKFMLPLPTDVDSEFIRKMVRNIGQQMLGDPSLAAVIVSPLKAVLYRIDPGVKLFRCKFQTLPGRQFEVRTVAYKRIEAELRKAGIPFAESVSKVIVQDSSGARLPAPAAPAPEKTAG